MECSPRQNERQDEPAVGLTKMAATKGLESPSRNKPLRLKLGTVGCRIDPNLDRSAQRFIKRRRRTSRLVDVQCPPPIVTGRAEIGEMASNERGLERFRFSLFP